MADSAESTISRPARARSQKRRTSAVSPETENKLARAARSAQRLAQLSDVARDDSTLDLFPDDTARAEQQAMNIDVRQGTLQGFELPDVVLAAVGAPDRVGFAVVSSAVQPQAEGKGGSRAVRGASSTKDYTLAGEPHDGQMVIETELAADGHALAAFADSDVLAKPAPSAKETGDAPAPAASLAAASVVRSVVALRQPSTAATEAVEEQEQPTPAADTAQQRRAANAAKTAASSRETDAAASSDPSSQANGASAAPRAPSYFASTQAQAPRATPELDHARATAFADTVDALYGVIADQRRAAGDHSRRMKWLLTIVVCALLMTIAIGIAQTLLLFRLAHQQTAQEQRIEQMMLNQQATLATLLDTDSSTTSLPVSAQIAAPAPSVPAPAAPSAKPADTHAAHAQHAQRRKSAHTH
jgi:hypothetical protein